VIVHRRGNGEGTERCAAGGRQGGLPSLRAEPLELAKAIGEEYERDRAQVFKPGDPVQGFLQVPQRPPLPIRAVRRDGQSAAMQQ
jgi:hypothetical protein